MGLGDAFDAVMDWAMDGNTFVSMVKTLGVVGVASAAALAVIMAPFIYVANGNQRDFRNDLAEMDSRPTVVFNSVADCTAKGFSQAACEESQKHAMDIAGSLGTGVSYSSGQECETNHQSCDARTTTTTTFIMSGKVMVPITTTTTTYYPHIVGWMAERDNLNKSAALYQGPHAGQAVRWDGHVLNF